MNIKKISLLTIIAGLAIFYACDKEINENYSALEQLNPVKADTEAGAWKTVVLAAPTDVTVPAPTAGNSAEYLQEIASVKNAASGLSNQQKEAVKYWSAGSVLRWNEIMRELVAKHNLPPAPNADNPYSVPDANTPLNYPQFPFANPPYAARAYAYVSVAQYDALVASSYYKTLYNRPSAYNVDASMPVLVPKNTTPGYPCEDAVVAGAAYVMLRALFPGDTTFINEKVAEAANYKQWAGAAVPTDVQAGLNLGKAVATKVLARAKTDGTKNALGTPSTRDSLQKRIEALGETPWISLDAPIRPAMLPFFGAVKPWLFSKDSLVAIRPPQPPSTNSAEFKAQVAEVKKEADPSDREKFRITHFWADGAGTYTPPGHWNAIAFDQVYAAQQSEVRAARNFALLNMSMMDAAIACWEAKYHYYVPRPSQADPDIKTLTGVPNFPAYTSGHSTFSSTAATVLGHIFPAQASNFDAMAKEASLSRLYGGIHYRMDCDEGLKHGQRIGAFAVARARIDGAE